MSEPVVESNNVDLQLLLYRVQSHKNASHGIKWYLTDIDALLITCILLLDL